MVFVDAFGASSSIPLSFGHLLPAGMHEPFHVSAGSCARGGLEMVRARRAIFCAPSRSSEVEIDALPSVWGFE